MGSGTLLTGLRVAGTGFGTGGGRHPLRPEYRSAAGERERAWYSLAQIGTSKSRAVGWVAFGLFTELDEAFAGVAGRLTAAGLRSRVLGSFFATAQPMTVLRVNPAALRWLLLSAVGGSVQACTNESDVAMSGADVTGDRVNAGDGRYGGTSGQDAAAGTAQPGASPGPNRDGGADGGTAPTEGDEPSSPVACAPDDADCLCTAPTAHHGEASGTVKCAEGYLHRRFAGSCPNRLPREGRAAFPDASELQWPGAPPTPQASADGGPGERGYTVSKDECESDADCGELEMCVVRQTDGGECYGQPFDGASLPVPTVERVCVAGCVTDSDCGADQVCICSDTIGFCHKVSSTQGCREDADCDDGALCLSNGSMSDGADTYGFFQQGYSSIFETPPGQFACQHPEDECRVLIDCTTDEACWIHENTGIRKCEPVTSCGRPFLVGQTARTAQARTHSAWVANLDSAHDLSHLELPADSRLRAALTAYFTRSGLLEHASIAAFARFTLQLVSLGAPAELVQAACDAQRDEAQHAVLCFAVASRYAGRPLSPGALSAQGVLDDWSPESVLRTTFREGCIGETRAALEAAHAAQNCADPVLKAVLERIAADEARHAELAWRTVRWLLDQHRELIPVLEEEFLLAQHQHQHQHQQQPEPLAAPNAPAANERFTLLDPTTVANLHQVAQREVIAPCARVLIRGVA